MYYWLLYISSVLKFAVCIVLQMWLFNKLLCAIRLWMCKILLCVFLQLM
jgi:hypothetical protein